MAIIFVTACFSVALGSFPILPPMTPDLQAAIELDAATPRQGYCSQNQLVRCQKDFNEVLGIADTADWDRPEALAYALDRIMVTGIDGMINVCNARQTFYNCLQPNYDYCMSLPFWVSLSYSPNDAYMYTAVMNQLEFMCGGGMQVGFNIYPCLQAAMSQTQADPEVLECIAQVTGNITVDPSHNCVYEQNFLNCWEQAYEDICGRIDQATANQAGWYVCETLRVAYNYGQTCPDLRCYVYPVAKKMEPGQQNSGFLDIAHDIGEGEAARKAAA